MNKFEYTISTQVIGTKDGRATYEVRKTLNNENGKRCVIIALYPTVSLIAPCVMDNSTLFLINRANELGYNDFRIVNIYSKVCKGKPSVKQLNKDDDNLAYAPYKILKTIGKRTARVIVIKKSVVESY